MWDCKIRKYWSSIFFKGSFSQDVRIYRRFAVSWIAETCNGLKALLCMKGWIIAEWRKIYTLAKQSMSSIAEFLATDGSVCPEIDDLMRLKLCLSFLQSLLALRADKRASNLHEEISYFWSFKLLIKAMILLSRLFYF